MTPQLNPWSSIDLVDQAMHAGLNASAALLLQAQFERKPGSGRRKQSKPNTASVSAAVPTWYDAAKNSNSKPLKRKAGSPPAPKPEAKKTTSAKTASFSAAEELPAAPAASSDSKEAIGPEAAATAAEEAPADASAKPSKKAAAAATAAAAAAATEAGAGAANTKMVTRNRGVRSSRSPKLPGHLKDYEYEGFEHSSSSERGSPSHEDGLRASGDSSATEHMLNHTPTRRDEQHNRKRRYQQQQLSVVDAAAEAAWMEQLRAGEAIVPKCLRKLYKQDPKAALMQAGILGTCLGQAYRGMLLGMQGVMAGVAAGGFGPFGLPPAAFFGAAAGAAGMAGGFPGAIGAAGVPGFGFGGFPMPMETMAAMGGGMKGVMGSSGKKSSSKVQSAATAATAGGAGVAGSAAGSAYQNTNLVGGLNLGAGGAGLGLGPAGGNMPGLPMLSATANTAAAAARVQGMNLAGQTVRASSPAPPAAAAGGASGGALGRVQGLDLAGGSRPMGAGLMAGWGSFAGAGIPQNSLPAASTAAAAAPTIAGGAGMNLAAVGGAAGGGSGAAGGMGVPAWGAAGAAAGVAGHGQAGGAAGNAAQGVQQQRLAQEGKAVEV